MVADARILFFCVLVQSDTIPIELGDLLIDPLYLCRVRSGVQQFTLADNLLVDLYATLAHGKSVIARRMTEQGDSFTKNYPG